MRITLEQAAIMLKQGKVVAIPTETVYGLAADARNEHALQAIYAIKERPADNPLIVHIGTIEQVLDWAETFSPLAQKLASVFWPGPLTLVLPAKPDVSLIVRAGEPTIALRVPAHPIAQQLLQQTGLGLAAPSANKYTQLSPTTAQHVEQGLGKDIPVLDGGACQIGIESTIVAVDGNQWRLLRSGMITEEELEAIAGLPASEEQENLPKAPGQHLLHYSPRTPVQIFSSRDLLLQAAAMETDCAVLLIGEGVIGEGEMDGRTTFNLPNNATDVAEKLYATLHQMDALHTKKLLIETPPQSPEWLAIHDRLNRASYTASSIPFFSSKNENNKNE